MSTILLVGVDLMFRSKLEGLLDGYRLVTSDSVDAPDLVICDISRVEAEDVADAWPETPIVGCHRAEARRNRGSPSSSAMPPQP